MYHLYHGITASHPRKEANLGLEFCWEFRSDRSKNAKTIRDRVAHALNSTLTKVKLKVRRFPVATTVVKFSAGL